MKRQKEITISVEVKDIVGKVSSTIITRFPYNKTEESVFFELIYTEGGPILRPTTKPPLKD